MSHGAHPRCMPNETVNGSCAVAQDGKRNVDLFSDVDRSGVLSEEVAYFGETKGFLARPNDKAVHPAVVMIHEWWGLNDNIKDMAVLLSKEGFVVLAVDLYEGEVANSSDDARRLTAGVKQERANENMRSAVKYLRERNDVREDSMGSMGWCFGGGQSLQLALSGEALQATVIYYGKVSDDKEQLSRIKWPILGIFAGNDLGIPPSSVNAFKASLDELSVKNDITIYPNVDHAFANPSGARYAPNETKDAWNKTVKFLHEVLDGQKE